MWIPFLSKDDGEDWKKVIEVMYEYQIVVDQEVVESKSDLEKFYEGGNAIGHIAKEAGLDLSSVWDSIDYMIALNLIEEIGKHPVSKFGLTQDGLKLAHRIKTERQQQTTNRRLLWLTVILAVLTIGLFGIELYRILYL